MLERACYLEESASMLLGPLPAKEMSISIAGLAASRVCLLFLSKTQDRRQRTVSVTLLAYWQALPLG
jgi:hypothetical protein